MARFKADFNALAHILDLPDGVEIVAIRQVKLHNGAVVAEFETEGGALPDAEVVLEYTRDSDTGRVWLSGYTEV